MFATYKEMSKASTAAYVFSKIYLYVFIALFIYVVLSVFISLISDTYETLHVSPLPCGSVLCRGRLSLSQRGSTVFNGSILLLLMETWLWRNIIASVIVFPLLCCELVSFSLCRAGALVRKVKGFTGRLCFREAGEAALPLWRSWPRPCPPRDAPRRPDGGGGL